MALLKRTIVSPVLRTPVPDINMKGKGKYHDDLNSINKLKVIHKLTIKPHYYALLRSETKIQRGGLRRILNYFIDKKAIIPHKYNFISKISNENNNIIIKTGLEYFILDLDNEESLMYLTDIHLDNLVKGAEFNRTDNDSFKKLHEHLKISHIKAIEINYDFSKMNRFIQLLKVLENTDPSFSPQIYSKKILQDELDEMKKQSEIKITKLKNENPEMYSKYLEIQGKIKNDFFIKDQIYEIKKHAEEAKQQHRDEEEAIIKLLQLCNDKGISKYDVLIYFAWCYPSRENYLRYWNIIRNNSTSI